MFYNFRFVGIENRLGKVLARQLGLGLGEGLLVVDIEFGLRLSVVLENIFEAMLI